MDFLKQEIASKKRALDQIASATSTKTPSASDSDQPPPTKYIRRAELDRLRDEEEQRERARKEQDRKERLYGAAKRVAAEEQQTGTTLLPPSASTGDKSRSASAGADDTAAAAAAVEQSKPEAFNVSNDECVRRLRRIGQPIRLFAESDKDRRLRLRALELIEERTEGQRNDFMRAMEGQEIGLELAEVARRSNANGGGGAATAAKDKGKGKGKETPKDGSTTATPEPAAGPAVEASGEKKEPKPKDEDVLVDLDLVRSNPHKVYPQIYHALKRVLKEWEQSLADRPENIKRSQQGKMAAATCATSAEYLKPLFKSLRKRELAPDVLQNIAEITHNMQKREYLRANDAYLRLSIGNAPWPIGVTMVGIHERSGREKIFSNNVAHVLNDETSRKYIQSLKRLLTFAQAVRPPADVSQKMG
ncbi:hypothetical protein JCM8208_006053 [Rhodotorula glutinis]